MGTLKVNGNISATGNISASSFLGNASSASKWATARTIKIGKTGKSVDGSSNVSWTHYEIGVPYCYDTSPTGSPAYSHWGMLISREENKYGQSGTGDNYFIGVNSSSQLHIGHQLNGTSVITWTNILSEHNYSSYALPLSGGTMSGSPVIKFPASAGSIATSDPMAITYGRISAYGTLCINANTDNSGTEYIILTAGKGLSSSTTDGLAIGTSTLTWQGATVLTTGNFPADSSLQKQTDTWISASSLDVNTYYPVVIDIPFSGLCRIRLAVQLNSGTKPSWSTHYGGFTSNIDVKIIASGWGTVYPDRYLLQQDDYSYANVKPAYFAGQLREASKAVFYVRGGGSYRFICDWQNAAISLRTSSSTYKEQTVAPTTSTSIFHDGSKSHLYCNVDYASNADTLDGYHYDSFAWASHSHSYLPLSGGTMSGHLVATSGITWNHTYWQPNGNITCTPTGNGQEWSFDVGASGYTGCYWHVWSTKNGCSMLRCDADNNAVGIPNGPLYLGSSCYGPNLPGASYVGQIFFKT